MSPLMVQRPIPPEPVQQGSAAHEATPADDLATMRVREDRILNNYGWVDQSKGVVRVPIDRAMRMVAEQGLPARPPATQRSEAK